MKSYRWGLKVPLPFILFCYLLWFSTSQLCVLLNSEVAVLKMNTDEYQWLDFFIPFDLFIYFFIVTEEATMEETGPVLAFQVCCPG